MRLTSPSSAARALARAAVLLLIVVALGVPAARAQSAGQFSIQLLDAPVERRDDPRAQVYIVDHLGPGATIERRVRVSNGTDRELPIELYAAAAEIRDGSWQPLPERLPNEITDWITVDPPELVLAPGERADATVTIRVPGVPPEGEFYAVVWAEAPPGGGSGGVSVVNRVGVRVYLSVGEGQEPVTDFEVHSLTARRAEDGTPVVEATVENTGQRAVDMVGELTLSEGPAGLSAGPFTAEGGTTLGIGESAPVSVRLDPDLPAGPWLARMVARSGELEKAAEATITFPEAPGASAEAVAATEVPLHQDRGFLIPLALGLLVLAFLLVLVVWWFARRRGDDDDTSDDVDLVSDDDEVGARR